MKTMVDGELVTLTLLDTAETHAPTNPPINEEPQAVEVVGEDEEIVEDNALLLRDCTMLGFLKLFLLGFSRHLLAHISSILYINLHCE